MAKMDISKALRKWRQAKKLTQKALSVKAHLSESEVAHIESGRRSGKVETLAMLAKALGVSTGELIDGEL